MNYIEVDMRNMCEIEEMSAWAGEIVKEHFDPIIGAAQNDYMIDKYLSVSAIKEQLEQGFQYFFVRENSGENVGFLACGSNQGEMLLSKFYLHKSHRGKGISKHMLQFIIEKAREAGLASIVLNVNKHNNAILAYEKLGFKKIGEVVKDIGHGFVMDDYVYVYEL